MAKSSTTPVTTSTPAATLAQAPEQGLVTTEQQLAPVQSPTPEQVAEGVAEMARELAPLLNAVAAKQAEEEARLEALLEQADKALVACRKAYSRGDKAHRQGLLESGRLASEYVALRLEAGATRDVAVQCVEGELAKVAWDKVDGNRLIRVYHVYRLLADGYRAVTEATANPDVPYSHLRDVWTHLVQRVEDPKQESWQLLPGQEQAAVATFVHCVKEHLDLTAVTDKVKAVQAAYARDAARRKQEQEEAVARAKQAKEQDVLKARAEAMEQARLKAQAERELKAALEAAKQDASEETTAAVQAAADKLAAEQRAMVEKQARAEQEQREAARLERERRQLEQERERLAEKAAKQAAKDEAAAKAKLAKEQGQDKPADSNTATHPGVASVRELQSRGRSGAAQGKGVTDDPLAALAEGTAKDSAEQLVAVFECHQAPDDLLEALLKGLAHSQEMSARARRACKEALLSMHRPAPQTPGQTAVAPAPATAASPSPVALAAHLTPATNGTPAAAAK